MKIEYNGYELDENKEIIITNDYDCLTSYNALRILTNNKFGFNVKIKYGERYNNEIYYINNCTEIHNLYDPEITLSPKDKKIAFESDIHETGFTKEVEDVEWVSITDSKCLYDEYVTNVGN